MAESSDGDGLISALAAGVQMEAGTHDRLAGPGKMLCMRDQIHIDAADDDNGFHV
jgi:hypothetical protein